MRPKSVVRTFTSPDKQPLVYLIPKLYAVVVNHSLLDTLNYGLGTILQCFEDALTLDQKRPKDDKAVTCSLPIPGWTA